MAFICNYVIVLLNHDWKSHESAYNYIYVPDPSLVLLATIFLSQQGRVLLFTCTKYVYIYIYIISI